LFCLKPVQVKRVLSSRNTAVSSRSLLDGQTDSQPVIGGSCLSGGDRFGAAVLSLRPVNPEDLQSRLISEQIAESERVTPSLPWIVGCVQIYLFGASSVRREAGEGHPELA
jgi:hypothetical protein